MSGWPDQPIYAEGCGMTSASPWNPLCARSCVYPPNKWSVDWPSMVHWACPLGCLLHSCGYTAGYTLLPFETEFSYWVTGVSRQFVCTRTAGMCVHGLVVFSAVSWQCVFSRLCNYKHLQLQDVYHCMAHPPLVIYTVSLALNVNKIHMQGQSLLCDCY